LAIGDHRQLMAISSPTLVSYARRWKWDVVLSSENLAPERPPAWGKVVLIQQLLRDFEYVLWVDSDALFVRDDRDVLAETERDKDIYLVEHPQASEDRPVVPNSGVVLFRQGDYTADFLKRLWDKEEYIEHNWWENAALLDLLGHSLDPPWTLTSNTPDRAHVKFLDVAWNSVPGQCDTASPVIRHHARADGRSFETRLAGMSSDLWDCWLPGVAPPGAVPPT
jgi:hypothetical protein